jgi:hypothetical protein
MDEGMEFLDKNEAWDLVELPTRRNPIELEERSLAENGYLKRS